ncbi:MAG: hypothetical protein KJ882_08315 [Proteobacteria bacterium]|nr:hypothetical protein [Pseudomonadota bacterium]MBU4010756.1 hypothetical protein [Pseudomonadota bacterium]
MQTEREAKSDVQLFEDMTHLDKLPAGDDFMEDFANLILGESEGYDFCLVPNFWHMGGGKKGKWKVDNVLMVQTTFLMLPQDQRGRMQNNDFIGNRLDPTEWAGAYKIEQTADKIIWQRENIIYVSRPPYWEIKGTHMGVTYDLIMGGMGNTTRTFGAWSDLATTGRAGYDQRCWAEGTISVGGKTYKLKNGYAIHERLTFGHNYDPMESMRTPYYWVVGMNESLHIYFFALPGEKISFGRVYLDGKEIPFGQGEITIDELELWTDPKTSMQVPIRWHVNMNSAAGVVDMNMTAGGRGIFCFLSRTGYTVRYPFMAQTNGRIFTPDGKNVSINDLTTYVEWGKAAMPLEGGST